MREYAAYCAVVPTPPGQGVFQLRITLDDVEPTVWRRLLVPASVRLAKLHDIFQAGMGWTNSHLHSFTIGGERYGRISTTIPRKRSTRRR